MADSTSSSSLHSESAGRISSTSLFARGDDGGKVTKNSSSRRGIRREADGKVGDRESRIRKCPPILDPPFQRVDSRGPMIDISSLDYKAYRHRLIEATLRRQYDDLQPPGDVVLNSLHLNSADSVIGVRLNDRYKHSLFDFVEEYYDVAGTRDRKNVERPRPLDHFLSRGARRPRTSEKETETTPDNGVDCENNGNHLSENYVDGNPSKWPDDMDDNGNPCVQVPLDDGVSAPSRDRNPKSRVPVLRRSTARSCRRETDETISEHDAGDNCPRSADSTVRMEPTRTKNDRPGMREAIRMESSRPGTGESRKKLEDHPPTVPPLLSKRRAERQAGGRSNFALSSGEIAGIRSDSRYKRQDDQLSCRSRESSISPRSRACSRPPWMSGNGGVSFNRKYGGNIAEISSGRVSRPLTARGTSGPPWQKLALSSRGRNSKESSTSRNPAPFAGRRAASFVASREKELTEATTIERRQREESLATRRRRWREKSKEVEGARMEDEERRASKTKTAADSPSGEKMSASGTKLVVVPTSSDNVGLSFLSSPARTSLRPTRKRSLRAASFSVDDAPVPAGETRATKEAELITTRSERDGTRGSPVAGDNTSRPDSAGVVESTSARDRRENFPSAKLNRGGRRRLRSAENPSKGVASLNPQIELSAEVLNPADDDTDKSAIPDGERLAELTSRIDRGPRWQNANTGVAAVESDERIRLRAGSDVKSNSANDDARSTVPKIIRNLRERTGSANNLRKSREFIAAAAAVAATTHPARRDANSETKSGLNGAKLNTGSNGAVDEMRYDESPAAKASSLDDDAEGLQLPRHDSKIGLAMNSALRRYVEMLKRGLREHGDRDGVALASLSLSDAVAILSEQRTPLTPEEIQELQAVLDRIERNPELLCKLSRPSMENVA